MQNPKSSVTSFTYVHVLMITLTNGLASQLVLSLSRQVSLEHQILCRMSQSMAIMEYINDVRPEAALLPKDPKSRAKVCPNSLP